MFYIQGFIGLSWGVIQNPSNSTLEGANDGSAPIFLVGNKQSLTQQNAAHVKHHSAGRRAVREGRLMWRGGGVEVVVRSRP